MRHRRIIDLGSMFAMVVVAIFAMACGESSKIDILIIAPHPDDDIITSSGVIARALARGESVRIVFMTNGDVGGNIPGGLLRQDEAVAGQAELGVPEEHLIFLGYPDADLGSLYYEYTDETDILDANGQSVTYGQRGLGASDYHTYKFGSPAAYNGYNVTMDLATILATYTPSHVFTTSDWDGHADHRATYLFLRSALDAVRQGLPQYDPIIHKTIVWSEEGWPNSASPGTYFDPVPTLDGTPLVWSQRESLDVPLSMQDTDLPSNPKFRAIDRHTSQGGFGSYIGRFLHKDEFFWPEQAGGNRPPVPNAGLDAEGARGAVVVLDGTGSFDLDGTSLSFLWTQASGPSVTLVGADTATPSFTVPETLLESVPATFELVVSDGYATSAPDAVTVILGSDIPPPENVARHAMVRASSQNESTQQFATKAVDGIVDGAPGDFTREWATLGEGAGAWIELSWLEPQIVNHIVLFDRPNPSDWIVGGTLSFSDGTTIDVESIDNAGGPVSVEFSARRISSVRFEITEVGTNTLNVGLAEFQVFSPFVLPSNIPPVAVVEGDQFVGQGASVTLVGSESYDLNDDFLEFEWTQIGGPTVALSGAHTSAPSFVVPAVLMEPVVYRFQLVVGDGVLFSDPATVRVFASPPVPENVALGSSAYASSQNEAFGQLAAKAIDGVADGAPGDYTREWVTSNERAGAWIELVWSEPQSVDRVVLYDRPNGDDQVLAGVLSFSDGTSVTVGALANAGGANTYTFTPKLITSLRFTVTAVSASTHRVGLAEMEVWNVVGSIDYAPVALVGGPQEVLVGSAVQLDGGGSYDPGGQALTYLWTQLAGPGVSLSSSSAENPTFEAPAEIEADVTLSFALVVSDGNLSSEPAIAHVVVQLPPPPPPPANLALSATASASSEAPLQEASKAIDGYPTNGTYEWSSAREGAGAWIELSWTEPQLSNRIVLYDRPNSDDQILAGILTFSDGFELGIGALDNAGAATVVSFPARYFTWVRLTITQVSGSTINVGLAEFEVLEIQDPDNLPPIALVGSDQVVSGGELVTLSGDSSYDPEGSPLSYEWTQVLGPVVELSDPSAPNPAFVAPSSGETQVFSFSLLVSDGASWSESAMTTVTVLGPPPPPNLALSAFASASSENASTGQLASSAIDGVIEGYSNGNHTHEWATVGEGVGAWLQLDWLSPQMVGSVVLFDRPNGDDHVLQGILEFSDGTVVSVGPLHNVGAGLTIEFEPREVTFVRFTVTQVSTSTSHVGLSEFQVFP